MIMNSTPDRARPHGCDGKSRQRQQAWNEEAPLEKRQPDARRVTGYDAVRPVSGLASGVLQ